MKKKIMIILITAALGIGGVTVFLGNGKNSPSELKEVIVKSLKVENLTQSVSAEGDVEITNEQDIYVSKSMRVDKVFFEENDTVNKGDVLITFDPETRNEIIRNIENQKLKIEKEELNLEEYKFEISKISIESAERAIEEDIAKIDKYEDNIKIAELEKLNIEKELKNATDEYQVKRKLFDIEGISFVELNTIEISRDTLAKNLETKLKEIKEYKIDFEEAKKDLELDRKNLIEAKEKYNQAIISRKNDIRRSEIAIKEYKLEIESLEEELAKTVEQIISPVNGTITEINAEENFMVNLEESLMSISDINSQVIKANISSYDINSVEIGQKVKITSDALGNKKVIAGTISKISSLATIESGNGYEDVVVEVEISFDSKTSGLRPGYNVDIEIVIGTKENTVTVPSFAVNTEKGKKYIMVLNNDNTVSKKIINTGIETTTKVEALNLDGSERIIMNARGLSEGQKVKVVDKMTSEVSSKASSDNGPPDGGGRP